MPEWFGGRLDGWVECATLSVVVKCIKHFQTMFLHLHLIEEVVQTECRLMTWPA